MRQILENENTNLLSRSEVASLFGVSAHTITRWAREGRLSHILTRGGQYRFPEELVKEELILVKSKISLRS